MEDRDITGQFDGKIWHRNPAQAPRNGLVAIKSENLIFSMQKLFLLEINIKLVELVFFLNMSLV